MGLFDYYMELISMLPTDLSQRIIISDGVERSELPEWATSLVWLGAWCRANQVEGKRLIVFTVLPTRSLAAAFASLGSLVAGAGLFEDSLSWPVFRNLPIGSNVFFNYGASCGGLIVGFEESYGDEFIKIEITKSSKKSNLGTVVSVSRNYFDQYHFTENKPPSLNKSQLLGRAGKVIGSLVDGFNEKWLWSDSPEGLLITGLSSFEESIENLTISVDDNSPVSMSDILCMGRNKNQAHAKLRVDHSKGCVDGVFPLAILDGSNALMTAEHLYSARNMLIILDRSEYQAEAHDIARASLGLSTIGSVEFQGCIPGLFVPGIEIAATLIEV